MIVSKYKGEKKMLKHRKWVVVLMLLLLVGSTDAADKGTPYPDGKGNGETLDVEITDRVLES